MSFEAIKGISDAEVQGKAKVAEAEAKARQMLVDADSAGKAALEAAKSQTAEKTAALDSEMLAEADQLRRAAELKLEDAAALVVERIVGS